MEALVIGQVGGFDAQQVFDRAGHVVALGHFGRIGHLCLERLLRGLGVLVQPDRDIGDEADAQRRAVEYRAITFDDAAALQLLHPPQACRRRQADPLREFEIADSPVQRELMQYLASYRVNRAHLLRW